MAGERSDRIYGSEQHRVAGDEARSIAEFEHRETFLVVQAGLVYTNVVVERQNLRKVKKMIH